MARYRAEGEAAFEPGSRRPHRLLNRVADVVNDRIVNLREQFVADAFDAAPVTIQWHLRERDGIVVSVLTIRRRLVAVGLVEPAPKKRPNHRRRHTAIVKVPPAIAYQRNPKDEPGNDGARDHYRIRHNRIDNLDIRYQPRLRPSVRRSVRSVLGSTPFHRS